MGDIIITEFEKIRNTDRIKGGTMVKKGLFFLIVTMILLAINQIYTRSLVVQTGLTIVGFVTAFLLFYCRLQRGATQKKQSLAEYSNDMECMEKVLNHLDIDTYNKLGLVIDEVRARITYNEQERKKKEKISFVGILGLAGRISCICLYQGEGGGLYVQAASMLSFFFIMSALLLACVYISVGIFSVNYKYKRLYELLLNVMITKF